MKKALIVHAYKNGPDGNWYPWLKKELEKKGYEAWTPLISTMDSDHPDMERMLEKILSGKFVNEETVVVGHSLGGVLTIRLAERVKFATGIVLAGWDFDDLDPRDSLFWPNKINHQLVKKNVSKWIVPISDNDPYVSSFMTERMAERLGAEVIKMGMKGHFTISDAVAELPEILPYL